jgi:hypothetical protein
VCLQLVLNERGFLSRHKTHVIHQGEGPVRDIKWKSDFIAWANDYVRDLDYIYAAFGLTTLQILYLEMNYI